MNCLNEGFAASINRLLNVNEIVSFIFQLLYFVCIRALVTCTKSAVVVDWVALISTGKSSIMKIVQKVQTGKVILMRIFILQLSSIIFIEGIER